MLLPWAGESARRGGGELRAGADDATFIRARRKPAAAVPPANGVSDKAECRRGQSATCRSGKSPRVERSKWLIQIWDSRTQPEEGRKSVSAPRTTRCDCMPHQCCPNGLWSYGRWLLPELEEGAGGDVVHASGPRGLRPTTSLCLTASRESFLATMLGES